MSERRRIVIMGAGGRDFHVFNTCYRGDAATEVVAITAAQIPHIDSRIYPAAIAGPLYPEGVPVRPEADLEEIVREHDVAEVVFAYSDVSEEWLEETRRRVEGTGARFSRFDPEATMLPVAKPSVAVCAVRTGCGKSAVSRLVASQLRALGWHPAVIRHPMPYGNLRKQEVQRFASHIDLVEQECTVEEYEEYEPHVEAGNVVFAGVDYAKIFTAAAAEGDVLLWDGGNNDAPFLRPDLHLTVLDPLRAGDELRYFPGRWNLDHAHVCVIGKVGEATEAQLAAVRASIAQRNPEAEVVAGRLPLAVSDPEAVRGKRVLVIEDGPTVTHGGMGYGAGWLAAKRGGAAEIVDPRPYARGEIADAFRQYPHLESIVPALGYSPHQLRDLELTIDSAECDLVVIGTPIDLGRRLRLVKPWVRVTYEFVEEGEPRLPGILERAFGRAGTVRGTA